MGANIHDLEKAVSKAVRYISKLQKEKSAATSVSGESAAMRSLKEENQRLINERKDARKRIRAIIRELDKVKR